MRPRKRRSKNKLVAQVEAARAERSVEVWAMDEHRVGLKPILRRTWARRGERPQVAVRPRYEWLYVYAFVCPETGESEFWLAPSVNSAMFCEITAAFLRSREQAVLLVLDQAGWHMSAETLALEADGVLAFEHLPPYSPELMPAERLWELTDERLANRVFERLADLEAVLGETCVSLTDQPARIQSRTLYHWWPGGADHTSTE
ncbi:IS630 family transposase [Rubrivirga sp. S365]|uniref:IS630 family transposase n=1 Tax=Rubrivirga litoralis TaxID=3075598 RepID=A0ABU3BVK2_9BACT|nr:MULTISPECIES: IS630 family transposase [unclassified Rubrivirga]MDT0633310.1 IS630 family transposase [Rubrivirga sp. F394]MDT7856836.1 IS630 family transposase [Rubrivirga sp. S365]